MGLVRSIDEESNSLYILTPIAPALLQGSAPLPPLPFPFPHFPPFPTPLAPGVAPGTTFAARSCLLGAPTAETKCPLADSRALSTRRVDVLVRGSLALPLTALTPAGASYNGADTRPYLALNSLGAAGTGSAAMKSRSNIARRGHQG